MSEWLNKFFNEYYKHLDVRFNSISILSSGVENVKDFFLACLIQISSYWLFFYLQRKKILQVYALWFT